MALAPGLIQFCGVTAAEAPYACGAAIAACILVWGIDFLSQSSAASQRAAFVNGFLDNAIANSPTLNVMLIASYNNVAEHASGVGQVIGDCGHTHQEINIAGDFGATQGFEIYTVGPGSNCCVEKWGDGGFGNWGYEGQWVQTTTSTGSLMNCINSPPPPPPPSPRPAAVGAERYQTVRDLVLVNGVLGRLLTESDPLLSFRPANSLSKWENSNEGPYYKATMQEDGNFVLDHFDTGSVNKTPLWSTNTGGKVNDPDWALVPQHDGNLVLYQVDAGGNHKQPHWNSATSGINIPKGFVGLSLQQDGNLVLYAFYPDGSCDPIWESFNRSPNGVKFNWPH